MDRSQTILSDLEFIQLTTIERHDVNEPKLGVPRYEDMVSLSNEDMFVVGVDVFPLAVLFDTARCGSRVYELMSIVRPADLLPYLYLTFINVNERVRQHVKRNTMNPRRTDVLKVGGLSLSKFDQCLSFDEDEIPGFARPWIKDRTQVYWQKKMLYFFSMAKEMQQRVRAIDDYLMQHEIGLIDSHKHRRDFLAPIERRARRDVEAHTTTSIGQMYEWIATLARNKTVQSIRCHLFEFQLWRMLVTEQILRSKTSGKELQDALYLGGPGKLACTDCDSRYAVNEPDDWGGVVDIKFGNERIVDLYVIPFFDGLHIFNVIDAGNGGSLAKASCGKVARFLLTRDDLGDLECATRVGRYGWWLYENKSQVA